jgi:spore coat protein CotH
MASRRVLAGAAVALLMLIHVAGAAAQTADDLFNDQVLHRIDLFVNTKDWYLLRANYLTNDYYPANMKWRGTTTANVAIRVRGTGSRSAVKPGFRVDFNRYATGRTFLGLKAVDLNNMVQDPSCLREALAMKVYRSMGVPAPRTAFAALYLNNAYFGLYLIVEEIDDVAAARLLGEGSGYLFEYKWTFLYNFEYRGSDLAAYGTLWEPKTRETESARALYAPIEAMIRTINDVSDEGFVPAVSEFLDLSLFMRLVAVQAAVAEADGLLGNWGLNNHYLYRFNGRNLHQFIVWDASTSFHAIDYPLYSGHAESVLMRRAIAVPALKAVYQDTLIEAAALFDQVDAAASPDQPNPGWLEREASRLRDLIQTAARADQVKPFSNAEFDAATDEILTFAHTRGALVRREVARSANGAGQLY